MIKRLQALEKKLKIPEEERTTWQGHLKEAVHVSVTATRLWTRAESVKLDAFGNPVKGKENKRATTPMKSEEAKAYFTPMSEKIAGRSTIAAESPLVGANAPQVEYVYPLDVLSSDY